MIQRRVVATMLATGIAVGAMAAPAAARQRDHGQHASGVVFVQTNEPAGNRIVVFDRGSDGRLTPAGSFSTGGNGGVEAPGTQSDHLGSQGSLVYDAAHRLLIAVNAGSDSVSTFTVRGDRLRLTGVDRAGKFPASVTVHEGLVYVLDSGGAGAVRGFRIVGERLVPIRGSERTLGLANSDPPFFLTSPGQVGFTPDGTQLIVTTKGSGSTIDVFAVLSDGRLSLAPVRNASATPVPFAFTFTPTGRLAVGEAGTSNVSTYRVTSGGTLAEPLTQSDGQTALCWILRAGDFYYVSNTGSNTISAFRIARSGQPSLIGVAASTEPGPIDLASPTRTRFLYADTGGGTVDEFHINPGGSLTKIGVVSGLPAGIEGIAAP